MPDPVPAPSPESLWRAAVAKVLKGAAFDTLVSRSADGIPIVPLSPKAETASFPRVPVRPSQFARADHPDRNEAAALVAADLEGGADGLVLTFQGAATARGFGLAPDSVDLDTTLASAALDQTALRLEAAPFAGHAARRAVVQLAERRGHDPATLDIDFGLDPLGAMARTGFATDPWPSLSGRMVAVASALRARGFGGALLRADGRPYHEAGASEAQELASVVATGLAYLRALEQGGQALVEARTMLSFTLSADADLLPGLAKIRAMRKLWMQVESACGLAPRPIRLHVETAWRMLARRDPWSNMLRGTLGCAAALLGGADGVTVLPFTAALGLPDAAARRLARNTPLVLLDEAHLGRVADPGAGSGAVEALTSALCTEAWALLQASEREGGLAASLAASQWQARIAATAERRRAAFAAGEASIVGTTVFANLDEGAPPVLPEQRRAAAALPNGPAATTFDALPSCRDAEPFEEAAHR